MMSREDKLEQLKNKQARKDIQIITNGQQLLDVVDAMIAQFKKTLGSGIEINELDELISQLGTIREFTAEVKELKKAIKDFPALPNEIKIENIDKFIAAIRDIKVEAPQVNVPETKLSVPDPIDYSKSINRVAIAFDALSKAVKDNVYVPSQNPKDYIPFRRVRFEGNLPIFDDGPWGGGGGGGSIIPVVANSTDGNKSVPVTNPDGTSIGSNITLKVSDIEIGAVEIKDGDTDTRLDVEADGGKNAAFVQSNSLASQATLALIKAKTDNIPAQGQALAAASLPIVLTATQLSTLTPLSTVTADTELPAAAALSDADSSTPSTPTVGAFLMAGNTAATSAQRLRTTSATFNQGATGLLAVSPTAQFDDTSPQTVTENSWGNLRISTNRNLYSTIRDAAGNERGLNINTNNAASVTGEIASAATDSGNPVKIGGVYNSTKPTFTTGQRGDAQLDSRGNMQTTIFASDTNIPVVAHVDNADAVAASSSGRNLGTIARNTVFNGTTYDRARTILDATNSVGTGIQAAGLVAQFDDTSPTAITENQFGNVRMSATRELYTVDRPINGTALNTYAVRITTNTTTTPTSSTAYISSITITTEVAGTTSTVTIRDKQGTPQVLVNGLTTTAASLTPTVINFQTPVKMVSGIDIITAGAVAGTVDVWVNYYQ